MHTWRTSGWPRESPAEEVAASDEYLMSVHSGDRPPSGSGRITADSGVGTATSEGLSLLETGRTKATSELEEGGSVPCSAGKDLERGKRDERHVSEPRRSEARNKDDGT